MTGKVSSAAGFDAERDHRSSRFAGVEAQKSRAVPLGRTTRMRTLYTQLMYGSSAHPMTYAAVSAVPAVPDEPAVPAESRRK
jgi:hypothetical protein